MQQKTQGAKRRKYDASFKEEVMKMIHKGRSASEVAQSLCIGENLIYKWKSRSSQQPAAVGKESSPIVPVAEEKQALHRRIRELEQERDILKKALGIFSRQT